MKITNISEIGEWLLGTCYSEHQAIEHFDLSCDASDLLDVLLDINIEMCPGCGWWFESGELVDDDDGSLDGFCEDCRKSM